MLGSNPTRHNRPGFAKGIDVIRIAAMPGDEDIEPRQLPALLHQARLLILGDIELHLASLGGRTLAGALSRCGRSWHAP